MLITFRSWRLALGEQAWKLPERIFSLDGIGSHHFPNLNLPVPRQKERDVHLL